MGVFLFINKLQKINKHIKLQRFSGTSSGAQTCYFAINDEMNDIIKISYAIVDTLNKYPYARPKPYWEYFFTKINRKIHLHKFSSKFTTKYQESYMLVIAV